MKKRFVSISKGLLILLLAGHVIGTTVCGQTTDIVILKEGEVDRLRHAIRLFEWAAYYENEWFSFLSQGSDKDPFFATWVGLLNSPIVRK